MFTLLLSCVNEIRSVASISEKSLSVFVLRHQGALMLAPSMGGTTKKTLTQRVFIYLYFNYILNRLKFTFKKINK